MHAHIHSVTSISIILVMCTFITINTKNAVRVLRTIHSDSFKPYYVCNIFMLICCTTCTGILLGCDIILVLCASVCESAWLFVN